MGRPGLALNSLIFSGLVLTLINPLILWDVGFQLSFMATLGLILLVPPLERGAFGLLQRWLKTKQVGLAMALLSELLIVTLAAQIITGPLILYHFGRFSLVSGIVSTFSFCEKDRFTLSSTRGVIPVSRQEQMSREQSRV